MSANTDAYRSLPAVDALLASEAFAPLLEKERKKELEDYLRGREVADFLTQYPEARFEPQEFVGILGKHNVRLYSIASS